MEENSENYREPKYTMHWLGFQTIYVLAVAFVLALIAGTAINELASNRAASELLLQSDRSFISQAIGYCFGVIVITLMSLAMIEIAFRKSINYLQYALIAMALTLFYLLLLAFSEKLDFGISYTIVAAMTIGLIALFIKGITHIFKAVILSAAIIALEYVLIFILIKLGSMALLIGSLCLFIILAVAMYFTLKLKVENEELIIK